MLHRRKNTSQVTKMFVELGPYHIPMVIYREWRSDWRISLGKKTVHLRIPALPSMGLKGDPIQWAKTWLHNKYQEDPAQFYHYILEAPVSGKVYQTIYGDYTLRLIPTELTKASGRMKTQEIEIKHPGHWNEYDKKQVLPKIVSRLFAQAFRPLFEERLAMLNEIHFRFNYHSISFKYNSSNWGSCSSKGNLNFNTRLFLAPERVCDYVIIHELAHLQVPDHSSRFWSVVSTAMPEYKRHMVWLKEHGQHLYF